MPGGGHITSEREFATLDRGMTRVHFESGKGKTGAVVNGHRMYEGGQGEKIGSWRMPLNEPCNVGKLYTVEAVKKE
jgi:hypothetical protein